MQLPTKVKTMMQITKKRWRVVNFWGNNQAKLRIEASDATAIFV